MSPALRAYSWFLAGMAILLTVLGIAWIFGNQAAAGIIILLTIIGIAWFFSNRAANKVITEMKRQFVSQTLEREIREAKTDADRQIAMARYQALLANPASPRK